MSRFVQCCYGCPRIWSVQSLYGQGSLNTVKVVPRTGQTARLTTKSYRLRRFLGDSIRAPWPGDSSKLFRARTFGMPFKRLTLLWLAGAVALSAAVAQGAHGKVSNFSPSVRAAHNQRVKYICCASTSGVANRREFFVTGVERSNSNSVQWENANEKPCQHQAVLPNTG